METGRSLVSKHQIQPECSMEMRRRGGMVKRDSDEIYSGGGGGGAHPP